jgi:hypothetical protein
VDALTLFGLVAVTLMLVCYALEQRSRWFVLGFAGACAMGSAYGFLQGAWPFGLVEAVWAVVALQRWRAHQRRAAAIGPGASASVASTAASSAATRSDTEPAERAARSRTSPGRQQREPEREQQ